MIVGMTVGMSVGMSVSMSVGMSVCMVQDAMPAVVFYTTQIFCLLFDKNTK